MKISYVHNLQKPTPKRNTSGRKPLYNFKSMAISDMFFVAFETADPEQREKKMQSVKTASITYRKRFSKEEQPKFSVKLCVDDNGIDGFGCWRDA